jgi:hypothetical protein
MCLGGADKQDPVVVRILQFIRQVWLFGGLRVILEVNLRMKLVHLA